MAQSPNVYQDKIFQRNEQYIEKFKNSEIMKFIVSHKIEDPNVRLRFLSCIQLFSNYFQKMVMLRYITTDDSKFFSLVEAHLNEEFAHNQMLMQDRQGQPPLWDPVLESVSCWFCWKMMVVDNIDKTLLMHLVLEASAEVFFKIAHKIMQKHEETNYFGIHDEIDEEHAKMGEFLFNNLREEEYIRLFELQDHGWAMMTMICDRIAAVAKCV